jgi:hypothetical protein
MGDDPAFVIDRSLMADQRGNVPECPTEAKGEASVTPHSRLIIIDGRCDGKSAHRVLATAQTRNMKDKPLKGNKAVTPD